MFVLRDTVQFSKNIDDVFNSLNSAKRTAVVHLGFASVPDNKFRGLTMLPIG
jgi:hypothetical protein